MPSSATKDIIAIGGSAGSGAVLQALVADLPADFPAAVLISTHIPSNSPGFLAQVLAAKSKLPVTQAVDGQPIERGHIYLAAPDRHLLLIGETIMFGAGPRENMARPSIDPMFRSAALSFGPRVVGLVLTGMLNDGAAGLHAIKSNGGTAVVQHPLDAEADQMPLAALEAVEVDHVASAADLGRLLIDIAGTSAGPALDSPSDELRLEVEIAAGARTGSVELRKIASPTAITCPDCHGVLSEVRGSGPLRYRCQIGHAYTADALAAHIDELDEAIRIALRVMEERVTLVERMARDARETGRTAVAELYEARAAEYRRYSATLHEAALTSLRLGNA
ncbi:two-component system chemotaxis response regulator CheB [Rhizobium leguminosarum]|uniref:protein-glutamate methylesterase n=3 Tax=Rhizobium leguminosarum TaxID=384 RepID=A0ABF7QWB0_RHILW|nr:chemotaxis protein CheB [Rhizobium leguminosarum]ACI58426.1 CheB methylesterase [Rhizobium leguminosarum bv. trifolii WSM2304]EJB06091.1 chemotaxis response regulator containing a CheY-like receiver domain and a methylesterase domain [Rhizobium leguminosarum bv. trifolii WSM597]MBB5663982.1 two-component system chemotaxis response regulator CheB [Rhizobium leguminosarum]NYJ10850.1 two-component system chemotaxis response regulator CheB [Rhizobium leguminosarum]